MLNSNKFHGDVAIKCNGDISDMIAFNNDTRDNNTISICCSVQGLCGYVFSDFLEGYQAVSCSNDVPIEVYLYVIHILLLY